MKTRKELFNQAVTELAKLGFHMELGAAPAARKGVYMVRKLAANAIERVWVAL